MASVRVRKDTGLLFLDFRWNGRRFREQTALPDTHANRERVGRVLAKIRKQIDIGTFDHSSFFARHTNAMSREDATSSGDPTAKPAASEANVSNSSTAAARPSFREFTQQWVGEHAVEWRRSHLRSLQSTIKRYLLPRFGDRPIAEITKADVFAFRSDLAKTPGRKNKDALSNKRINGIIGPLKQILNEAADRFDFASPVTNLRPLKVRKSDVFPFTLAEVEQILATVRPDYRDYLLVRFFTGMHSGEIDGLKWKYIDFDHRLILVREAFVLGEDEYTKTDGSQRDIQMSSPVVEALRRQEKATRKLSAYVFCNREGNAIDNKNFTERVWRPLLRHLGLAIRRPYQMRHTAATLWLAAGESPEWIARQLGHTSTQMLFKVYLRYVPNLTRQDGSAMERLLRSTFDSTSTQQGQAHGADER